MKYLTDQQAAKIPALSELDDEQRAQAVDDADRIYVAIDKNAWIDDEDLRRWAGRRDLDPDRITRALQLLTDTGRIVAIGPAPDPPAEPATSPVSEATDVVRLEAVETP